MKIDLTFQFETLDEMRQVFHCLLQDFKTEASPRQAPLPEENLTHGKTLIPSSEETIEETDIQHWIESQANSIKAVEFALTESKKPDNLLDFPGFQSILCSTCNIPFVPRRKDQKFCSTNCHKKYKAPTYTIICPTCNNPFQRNHKNSIFCSKDCRPSSIKPIDLIENLCPECGNQFNKKPRTKFCSKKCCTKAKNRKYNAKQALKKEAEAAPVTVPAPVISPVPVAPVTEKHYDPELLKQKLDKIKKDIPIKRERPAVEHYF
jgi:hypothetical protein